MAGAVVWYDKGKIVWTYAAGNPTGTALELRVGQVSGQYPIVKSYPAASGEALVSSVLPVGSSGQWYLKMVEKIATAEGVMSVEVPFVVNLAVPATLTVEVQ